MYIYSVYMCIHIYIYIYMYVLRIYIYIYIYIYIVYIHIYILCIYILCIYIYIYIYISKILYAKLICYKHTNQPESLKWLHAAHKLPISMVIYEDLLRCGTRPEVCIYPTPPPWAGWTISLIFKQIAVSFNWEFFFSSIGCQTKAKEPSPPFYLLMAGGQTGGFMYFSRVFAHSET